MTPEDIHDMRDTHYVILGSRFFLTRLEHKYEFRSILISRVSSKCIFRGIFISLLFFNSSGKF